MKKIALASLTVAALALPAIANAQTPVPAAAPVATATAPAGAPATGTSAAMSAEKKVELKDGSWADLKADNTVSISNDGGKTWVAVTTKGTLEGKDGSKITTDEHGKVMK